ncbi:hypothetical protein DLM85_00835 [Hymenobacter edaphi]|uniref:Succinate dehydrogenase n=1 Tax=Hymenobacter edaphi TaxID=2211146 RepID=A0A328BRX0_9BACT|nr:hypothetical protein DLM85_00835 [Hymenobacter edaphi]
MFIFAHLINHLAVLAGVPAHRALMTALRTVYRQPLVEAVLLLAVLGQVGTGLWQAGQLRRRPLPAAARVQLWTGLYLAFFLLVHTGAVLAGRGYFGLDTNVYYAAAGLNTWPFPLFFGPYYLLAVAAVFGHLAAVHVRKGAAVFGERAAHRQAWALGGLGVALGLLILYGMTDGLRGLPIPPAYLRTLGR